MDMLVDSGAFSAFNRGECIDLDDYIRFVKRNNSLIYRCVSLDVIPGNFGNREWRRDRIEAAAAASYANQQKMKEAGLNPLPVFHQDEDFHWLRKYLEDGEDYICLSASQSAGRREKLTWLRKCSKVLCPQGRPLVRTHGLGETSTLICHQFPFTSVDSTRWFLAAAYGHIPIPRYSGGKPNYRLPPHIVFMTDKTRGRRNHIDRRDDHPRMHGFLEEEVGVDVSQCREDEPVHRFKVWLKYLAGVEASSGVQIFHVTDLNRGQSEALDAAGIKRRLVSYFLLKKEPHDALAKYIGARTNGF